jgi:predicted adenine nucleotide alpha hydrolase (AANH) superfamily ATPase
MADFSIICCGLRREFCKRLGKHNFAEGAVSVVFPKEFRYTFSMMIPDTTPRRRPSLLLHICCGPCATVVIESIRDTCEVTGFYCNANIYPESEYLLRRDAARIVSQQMGVPLVEGPFQPELFEEAVCGFEQEPENGARCTLCYRFRLKAAARFAAENGFDLFASTLTTGPRKKASVINPIGIEVGKQFGVAFLEKDWKKQDGFHRSCELADSLGIYRQHYCGCRYSMPDGDR